MRKSRPILFSPEMSRATLDGRKTRTRRAISLPNDRGVWEPSTVGGGGCINSSGHPVPEMTCIWNTTTGKTICCPYGNPGDLLWVREEHYRFGYWEPVPGVKTKTGKQKWRFVAASDEVRFDAPAGFLKSRRRDNPEWRAWYKRLARFMPRALSRTTLEITEIRVERLHDISEQDAKAEGFPGKMYSHADTSYPKVWFKNLWTEINGKESWEANPWVWVVGFKVVS